jgi:hypothetical protein
MAESSAPTLTFINGMDGRPFAFTPRRVVLAGYTGRDREAVQRHIDELLEQGIPAPERTPELYRTEPSKVQIDGALPKGDGWSSGEVEFVLLVASETTFVTVGSDHTDRDLERTSVPDAKRSFAKVVGSQVWPLQDLLRDWDSLLLRSWVTAGGARRKYQEGPIATIMEPGALIDLLQEEDRADGLVLFSGTVPALEPAPESGEVQFEGEIVTPEGRVLANCNYTYEA